MFNNRSIFINVHTNQIVNFISIASAGGIGKPQHINRRDKQTGNRTRGKLQFHARVSLGVSAIDHVKSTIKVYTNNLAFNIDNNYTDRIQDNASMSTYRIMCIIN